MPIFLLGVFAQDIFAVQLHWLPASGAATLGYNFTPVESFFDHLEHLLLPMLVLAASFIAGWNGYMRSSMIETIKQDYMRTARARGVGTAAIMFHHALRNAVIPLVTVVALNYCRHSLRSNRSPHSLLVSAPEYASLYTTGRFNSCLS